MQGIGNDFVVIDAVNQSFSLTAEMARRLADRHFGVGCDQILIAESPLSDDVAFRYRIFNADGSEVNQCGNGARCFARFVYEKGLTDAREFAVETAAGIMILTLLDNDQVRVNMGTPVLAPREIPFDAAEQQAVYSVTVDGQTYPLGAVSMGNPHGILVVDDTETAPVLSLGPHLEQHARFPEHANISFMQICATNHIRLRVYERGAGETLACGSGACAAVVSGRLRGLLGEQVKVDLPGGQLMIEWQGETTPVFLSGPARFVFEGTITL